MYFIKGEQMPEEWFLPPRTYKAATWQTDVSVEIDDDGVTNVRATDPTYDGVMLLFDPLEPGGHIQLNASRELRVTLNSGMQLEVSPIR